jgi:hypothetical protein
MVRCPFWLTILAISGDFPKADPQQRRIFLISKWGEQVSAMRPITHPWLLLFRRTRNKAIRNEWSPKETASGVSQPEDRKQRSSFMIFRHCRKSLFVALFAVIANFCGEAASFAQTDRATLEGTITDASGGAISGARVKILAVATGVADERRANSNGYYRFPGLPVGKYQVTVTNASFKTRVVDEVILEVGQTRTLDVTLEVGAIEEKVEIKADAAPSERSSAEAATVIRPDQILNLPNNGRDWASFTLLAPFAQDDGGGDQRTIRFAGRARDDNNFTFDGVDAGGIQEQTQKSQTRLQISQDAVAEYRVSSALYTAEYGTQAGGQINVVTKSGSNDLRGTVFGYLRNSVFDARNFTDFDLNGNPAIPPFRFGQYGLTLGGPIVKDKTFYFLSYEGLRQLSSGVTQATVPTAAIAQQTLAASPQMCSILQAFPWRVSTGTIGSCAPKFVFPDGSFTNVGQNADSDLFTHAAPGTVHEDSWLVRIDHHFSQNTTLYGRAQRDISLVDGPLGNAVALDKIRTINHPANYFIALEHLFSPNLLNEAKVFINRAPFINPQSSPLPYAVNTNDWTTINNNNADHEVGTTFGVIDNLTWTRGSHAFKMGIEIRRIRLNQGKTADNNLFFNDASGSANTAFESAQITELQFNAPWCCHKYRRTFVLPYFQDEWKVRPNLTLNLGLRWEYYGVATEKDNRTTVFDLNQFHGACLGSGSLNTPFTAPINTPPCPKNPSLYKADYKNFDPRISLAWAPGRLHGKTVIRAGFGIYHGAAQNDDLNAGLESDTFRVTFKPATGTTPLIPAYQKEIPDLTAIPPGNAAPNHPRGLQREGRRDLYAETWGLTVEHQLPGNFLGSAAYLGTHGVRLFSRGAVNLCVAPVQFDPTNMNGDCVRPLDPFYTFPDPSNPGNTLVNDPYGSVDFKSDVGSSSYHAMQLTLERRFTNGLSFESRYTWSHSINDGAVGGGESNGPENVNCLPCDKGPSIFDIRHSFTANAVYELPFGPGKAYLPKGGVMGKIVGGWSFSGIGIWHTGHPLTVNMKLSGNDTFRLPDGNDQTNQRPDIVPGVPLTLPGDGHNDVPLINAAAFQVPPLVTNSSGNDVFTRFGNAGNGIIRALHAWQVDLALTKETRISERFSVQFGIQAFNVFNHVQLGDPNTLTLDFTQGTTAHQYFLTPESNFGVITSTNNFNNNNDNKASPNTGTGLPRQLQFMLRLKF